MISKTWAKSQSKIWNKTKSMPIITPHKGMVLFLFSKDPSVFEWTHVFDTYLSTSLSVQKSWKALDSNRFELRFENHFRKTNRKRKSLKREKNITQPNLAQPAQLSPTPHPANRFLSLTSAPAEWLTVRTHSLSVSLADSRGPHGVIVSTPQTA